MRKLSLLLLLAAVAGGGWCFYQNLFRDDEEKIRAAIEEMRLAAERKSADGLIAHFSNDYQDENGNTKFMVYGLIKHALDQVDELRVRVLDAKVSVAGDRAWATVTVVAEAKKGDELYYPFGSDEEPEMPRLTFKKTKTGKWLIIKVENVRRAEF